LAHIASVYTDFASLLGLDGRGRILPLTVRAIGRLLKWGVVVEAFERLIG